MTTVVLQSLIAQVEHDAFERRRTTAAMTCAGGTLCGALSGDGGKVLIRITLDCETVGQEVADITRPDTTAMLSRFEPQARVEHSSVIAVLEIGAALEGAPSGRRLREECPTPSSAGSLIGRLTTAIRVGAGDAACSASGLLTPQVSVSADRRAPDRGLMARVQVRFAVAIEGPILLGRDRYVGGGSPRHLVAQALLPGQPVALAPDSHRTRQRVIE